MASDGAVIAKGEWHPANSSRAVPAVLREEGPLLVAAEEERVLASAVPERTGISSRVGSIPRRVSFPDGSVFETRDNDGVDTYLRGKRGARSGLVHRLEQFHPRLILMTLAVILLATTIYRFAVPALVEVAVLVTPPFVPELIGSGTLASLDRTILKPSELPEGERQAISEGFSKLAVHSKGGQGAYDLYFRDGGVIGPNAFALPDGSLILTDALVKLANGDREMILGVLGHEIAHVEGEHSLRQLYRAAGIAALVMLIAGDVGSGVEDILTQGGALVALSYSRAAEAEADRRSVELMRTAGYDPAALARFFAVLEDKLGDHGDANILSSHPGTPQRQQDIRNYAAELEGRPRAR
ncbi:peptidase M48 Ste24p [Rhizobium sp. CF080]|uniref:M48 family metallopeptidase n=1 Tax=Rhizobium sp. (strain CF080) TaxID=1144310 RepID=UPI0002719283|nr:M48 family metallopeptidase [Rhizobium sp. CF080]EUC00221.1 peptidase M48 Ste24p [Rhizobium sp. CF080]